ncbi:MAG: ABC transporter substrate-binding protein [Alphaproteobacteria bacterium]|nr:ABC transporter substrate-binding protein [Alphaproteobacteria bacterium]
MRRRGFIALAGGAAAVRSLAVHAQAPTPTIGYLCSATSAGFAHFVAAFRRGLAEAGFVEGRNVAIAYRFADGDYEKLPLLAADLVRLQVAVIAATGGNQPARAAKAATSTVPIVFSGGGDPVQMGLVASLARPGSNATGVTNIEMALAAKRLELLREFVPAAGTYAALVNPAARQSDGQVEELLGASRALGLPLQIYNAGAEGDFAAAFADMARRRVGALVVAGEPFYMAHRMQLVAMAARHRIPAIYAFRDFCLAGGLASYGADLQDVHRQVGVYVGRILKGAKPSDLPVAQPAKFDLVVNLRTARALGLSIPPAILARADEVIE